MLLSTAFMVGLLGSVHCLGMCAPISWAVPTGTQKWQWLRDRMAYNLGRTVTYGLLGVLVGLLGQGFSLAGWQQGLSVFAGALLILGVLLFGMEPRARGMFKPLGRLVLAVKVKIGPLIQKRGLKAQWSLGMLNGLLPCGLVYAALLAAWSMGSVQGAASYMLLFGLGTLPMMLGAAIFGRGMSQRFKTSLWRLAPKLVVLVGLVMILRGLNLGIPYLSPKLRNVTDITECVGNVPTTDDIVIIEGK